MNTETPETLQQYLERQGRPVLESYTCPISGQTGPAFSFVIVDEEDDANYWFISTAEYLDREERKRRASAEELAKMQLAADWSFIRSTRNNLLLQSDWTQGRDAHRRGLTPELIAKWADYRQELADITETFSSPSEVIWPLAPQ